MIRPAMGSENNAARPLEWLTARPQAGYAADCERGSLDTEDPAVRCAWLLGVRRTLCAVANGRAWWQVLVVRLATGRDNDWTKALACMGGGERWVQATADELTAGRVRIRAQNLTRIRDRLSRSRDREAALYAWRLWRAQVQTGLRVIDLRLARMGKSGGLVDPAGAKLLKTLSDEAARTAQALFSVRQAAAAAERTLYTRAKREWTTALEGLPEDEAPQLDAGRHVALAAWRSAYDEPLLAALLGEEETGMAAWGAELHPDSDLSAAGRPPQRRKAG